MNTQLFFDDELLFVRENVRRTIGRAELIPDSVYRDGVSTTAWCTGHVFRKDGKVLMLYFGETQDRTKHLYLAESDDGVHFTPKKVESALANRTADHEIMPLAAGQEIADIYEDVLAIEDERYKMLMSSFDGNKLYVNDELYVSSDLLHWKKKDGVLWGRGTEPLAGVFYNEKKKCHTVLHRPFWGIRKVGYTETSDWKTFSPYCLCVKQDAFDAPLAETYGMKALPYAGMFIGFVHMYTNTEKAYSAKFHNGTMDVELAYSHDGRYWLRSLRDYFVTGSDRKDMETLGYENRMIWLSDAMTADDGSVYLYTTATTTEHGEAFAYGNHAALQVYKVRKDGFICLETDDESKPSAVATREKIWQSGEAHINLCAERATVAVYESDKNEDLGGNMLGIAHPIPGYTHEDCVPFSGDGTDWTPVFRSGKMMDALKGRTIVIEVLFEKGRLYSIAGNAVDVSNTEAGRYRVFGTLPEER